MKKTIITMMLLIAAMSMRAQYAFFPTGNYSGWGSPYEPGTPAWCWQQQNAMYQAAQQVQWQIRNNRPNWQQAPIMVAPDWSTYPFNNSYNSEEPTQNTSRMRTRDTRCTNCLGRGFNPKTVYMGNNQYRTIQDRCNFCHGRGIVKETYYE